MSDSTADSFQTLLELKSTLKRRHLACLTALLEALRPSESTEGAEERRRLIKLAKENCSNQTVLKWLRENSESNTFIKLVNMFHFLKKHISEEEKKDHDDTVDITFAAHGSIGGFMIPASCLQPLSPIRDVVLYTPWNCCPGGSEIAYGIATGRIKPEHRVFYCDTTPCKHPDGNHRPKNLPDHWNSMKKTGDQTVPNIRVSPLKPEDGIWKSIESLIKKYGPPGRNRIVIPFILPSSETEIVPFSVVTLALSLVLLQSRFKATVHLYACLIDHSVGQKFDRKYLEKQYACALDGTGMKCLPYTFSNSLIDYIKKWFYLNLLQV